MEYLLDDNHTLTHFFCSAEKGLVAKSHHSGTHTLCRECNGIFSVILQSRGEYAVLALTAQNELLYITPRAPHCIVTHISAEIEVLRLELFKFRDKLHFIYSARLGKEYILVYSPLDNNAMPKMLSKMCMPDFFIHRGAVYFTSENNILGSIDFSDFSVFTALAEHAVSAHIASCCGDDMITYIKSGEIFCNHHPVIYDPHAECPLLLPTPDNLLLLWRSHGLLKYKKSTDKGKSWSEPGQFITSEKGFSLCFFVSDNHKQLCYADTSGCVPRIFGKSHSSFMTMHRNSGSADNIQSERQAEIDSIKREIAAIKAAIRLQ